MTLVGLMHFGNVCFYTFTLMTVLTLDRHTCSVCLIASFLCPALYNYCSKRRPPSYDVMTDGGVQLTAPYHQLTMLQQNSRSQGVKQPSQTANEPSADAPQTSTAADAPYLLPVGPPKQQYSNAGEAASSMQGRSDMSQALLFNTAALEGNLAAAQRGDAVDLNAEELADSLADTAPVSYAPTRQSTSNVASGA